MAKFYQNCGKIQEASEIFDQAGRWSQDIYLE